MWRKTDQESFFANKKVRAILLVGLVATIAICGTIAYMHNSNADAGLEGHNAIMTALDNMSDSEVQDFVETISNEDADEEFIWGHVARFARHAVKHARTANRMRCMPCHALYRNSCDKVSAKGSWKNTLCRKMINRGAKNCIGCFYEEELNQDETFDQLDEENFMEEELTAEDIKPITQEDIDSLNKEFEEMDADIAEINEDIDSEENEYIWGAISRASRSARRWGNRAVRAA